MFLRKIIDSKNSFSFSFVLRFDFDSQAISPPAHDESFFYIRYPTGATNNDTNPSATSNNLKSTISEALTKQKIDPAGSTVKFNTSETKNMVQHTEPCKKFLNNKDRGK